MISIADLGNMDITLQLKVGKVSALEKINISDVFTIDRTKINDELSNQAALYAYFAVLASDAEANASSVKFNRDVLRSQVYAAYRAGADEKSKLTEKMLEMLVSGDEQIKEAELKLIEAEKKASILVKLERAMAQRKDMVYAVALNMRQELEALKADAVKNINAGRGGTA